MNEQGPLIMVVEDDYVDVEIIKRRLGSLDLSYEMQHAENGDRAMEFLSDLASRPEDLERLVVFLDINMPGMNGHQFLDAVRSDERLRRTIVFILSTSNHPRDRALAYDKNVAGYFVKSNLEGLIETITRYVENVEFPPAVG